MYNIFKGEITVNKKILAFLLAIVLLLSVVAMAGCKVKEEPTANEGDKEPTKEPVKEEATEEPVEQEIMNVKYVIPGGLPKDADKVMEVVNAKMPEDGYNISIELVAIPWDAWEQKTNIMMTTGEEFELIHCMGPDYVDYVSKGGLFDISGMIDEYGPNLRKNIPQWVWDATSIDGKNYVIPAWWVESALGQDLITLREDWLKENNIERPNTMDKWYEAMKTIKANWTGEGEEPYIVVGHDVTSVITVAHPEYNRFPFSVIDGLICVGNDGTVESWLETEEFKQDAALWRKAYQDNLIHPDVLSYTYEQMSSQLNSGVFLNWFGCALGSYSSMKNAVPDLEMDDLGCFRIHEEVPALRTTAAGNNNGISATSKHPEAAIMFIDWIYSTQDNYNLFTQGIQDEHWTDNGDGTYTPIIDPESNSRNYGFSEWKIGNMNLIRQSTTSPKAMFDLFNSQNETAVNGINLGFIFQPEPVAVEYANCRTELGLSVKPIYLGVVDFEENYDAMLEKMKAAGIDKVVAEYKKQLDAWLAKQ